MGSRAASLLPSVAGVTSVVVDDPRSAHAVAVAGSVGPNCVALAPGDDWLASGAEIVILASPPNHERDARAALRAGMHVISVSDDLADIEGLLDLDGYARGLGRTVLVGAGFAPGLTCLLARHGAAELAIVDEVHVAKVGTAGPACARQHHRALKSNGRDWRDGAWVLVSGGSGRELCWFPDPIGGADCYRAALGDPLLLHGYFLDATRVTARMSATRRDRLTARLPMLRPPHAEAGLGAIRVELRGRRNDQAEVIVFGCMERPSVAAGTTLAVVTGTLASGGCPSGAGGLGSMIPIVPTLNELARRGIRCSRFEGSPDHSV